MTHWLGILNVVTGVLMAGLSIPLLLGWISRNQFYGARLRQSFASEANWYRINKVAARYMIGWSCVIVVIGIVLIFVPPVNNWQKITAAFTPMLLVVGAVQAWMYARRSE